MYFFDKRRLTNIEFEIEVGIQMSDILVVIDFFNLSELSDGGREDIGNDY